jgi:alkanesulfonate monooxygenase SsuD/methylene tetrahydromethanopterin reductase-like flavin-dependent oxidoreductase (luciferase family)
MGTFNFRIMMVPISVNVTEFAGGRQVAQRLALGIIPGAGWRAADILSVAQEAEAAGFEAIFAAEVNIDVLAAAQLMGSATTTIKVGS